MHTSTQPKEKVSFVLEMDTNVYDKEYIVYKGRELREGDKITVKDNKIVFNSIEPTHIISSCKASEDYSILMFGIVDLSSQELTSLRVK